MAYRYGPDVRAEGPAPPNPRPLWSICAPLFLLPHRDILAVCPRQLGLPRTPEEGGVRGCSGVTACEEGSRDGGGEGGEVVEGIGVLGGGKGEGGAGAGEGGA